MSSGKESGSTTMKTLGSELEWVELLNESVDTSDEQRIGDIGSINRRSIVHKKRFCQHIYRYTLLLLTKLKNGKIKVYVSKIT